MMIADYPTRIQERASPAAIIPRTWRRKVFMDMVDSMLARIRFGSKIPNGRKDHFKPKISMNVPAERKTFQRKF